MGCGARNSVDGLAVLSEETARDRLVRTRVVADLGIIPPEVERSPQHTLQDMPISFNSEHRQFTVRAVEEVYIELENPQYAEMKPQARPGLVHDPMEVL